MTDVQAAAATFYADQLTRCGTALEYLGTRGLSPDLCRRLGLGYAPSGWRGLCDHLGVDDAQLVRANLGMTTSRGTVVDRLRHRIVFPVRDENRRLVGFTGRAAPGSSDSAPKPGSTVDLGGGW